jgi:hypothetical protein
MNAFQTVFLSGRMHQTTKKHTYVDMGQRNFLTEK